MSNLRDAHPTEFVPAEPALPLCSRYRERMKLPHTAFLAWASKLRFPVLAGITAAAFLVDLIVPDLLPVADELLLGLATIVLAKWKKGREERTGTVNTSGQVIDAEIIDER